MAPPGMSMTKRARGRPPRSAASRMKTRAWFRGVMLASGFESPSHVEYHLEPDLSLHDDEIIRKPRKYPSYASGSRVPERSRTSRYAVDLAEAEFPGTAYVFNAWMWKVLDGTPLPSVENVGELLGDMCSEVRDALLEIDEYGRAKFAPPSAGRLRKLQLIRTFDALDATVLLLAVWQCSEHAKAVFAYATSFLYSLDDIEPIAQFAAEVRELIGRAFLVRDREVREAIEDEVLLYAIMGPRVNIVLGVRLPDSKNTPSANA